MIMASSYLRFLVLHLLDHETADDLHKFVAVDLLRRSKVDHRSSELDRSNYDANEMNQACLLELRILGRAQLDNEVIMTLIRSIRRACLSCAFSAEHNLIMK